MHPEKKNKWVFLPDFMNTENNVAIAMPEEK